MRTARMAALGLCGLVLVAQGLGCGGGAGRGEAQFSTAIFAPADAEDPHFLKTRSTEQVRYRLEAPYPAESLLQTIGERLDAAGWEPMARDFWNPGRESSHETGWLEIVDQRTSPPVRMREWNACWEDSLGDVVTYILRYRATGPQNKPGTPAEFTAQDLERVEVMGVFTPAEDAERILKQIRRKRPVGGGR